MHAQHRTTALRLQCRLDTGGGNERRISVISNLSISVDGGYMSNLSPSFVADGFPWARRVRPRRGLGGGDPDAPVLQLSKGSVYERVDGWAGLWVGLLKQEAGHGEARLRRRRPCCAQTASCACPRRRRTSRCAASRPAARAQSRAAPRVHCSVGCIYPEAGPATPDAYACWNTFRCAQPRPHMQDACPAVHLRVSGSPSPHPRHAFAPRLPVGPN